MNKLFRLVVMICAYVQLSLACSCTEQSDEEAFCSVEYAAAIMSKDAGNNPEGTLNRVFNIDVQRFYNKKDVGALVNMNELITSTSTCGINMDSNGFYIVAGSIRQVDGVYSLKSYYCNYRVSMAGITGVKDFAYPRCPLSSDPCNSTLPCGHVLSECVSERCVCKPGYINNNGVCEQEFCSTRHDCGGGENEICSVSRCMCKDGFTKRNGVCRKECSSKANCGGGSHCDSGVCVCKLGFVEEQGECKIAAGEGCLPPNVTATSDSDTLACTSNAICTLDASSYACRCQLGFKATIVGTCSGAGQIYFGFYAILTAMVIWLANRSL